MMIPSTQSRAFAPCSTRRSACKPLAAVAERGGIGAENYVTVIPGSLLRPGVDTKDSTKARFEKVVRDAQDSICKAIEEVDGTKFRTDAWTREAGGGGITRVMQNGNVWEKAGIAVSVVYGTMPAEAYRAARGGDDSAKMTNKDLSAAGRVPFFACGISSVMHPKNPHCPTMHFNYRYFETEAWNGLPGQWWFGGGTDITPSYVDLQDMKHFHSIYKDVCDRHDPTYYARFKKWCDEYFCIAHRGETRGLGGIFFDDLNDKSPEALTAFAKDAVNHVAEAYCPIVKRHKDDKFTQAQKDWQQLRRGRYVEFNLVYDRGTIFGLKTGGRIESILMSMPVTASWLYDAEPKAGTPEAELLDHCRKPRMYV